MGKSTRDTGGQDARREELRKLAEKKVRRRVDAQTQAAKGDFDKLLHELAGQSDRAGGAKRGASPHRMNSTPRRKNLANHSENMPTSSNPAPVGYLILDNEAKIIELNRKSP